MFNRGKIRSLLFNFIHSKRLASTHGSHMEKQWLLFLLLLCWFCTRQDANSCHSAYIYFKKSWINNPLCISRTFINSVDWVHFRCSEITLTESSWYRKNKKSGILRFDFKFANMKIQEKSVQPFDNSALRK